MASSPGRPRRASHELLQEAAFELFQLRGYRSTTVEQIARTAGFSRATFFNFFSSKAELFWVETDQLIDALVARLREAQRGGATESLRDVILRYSDEVGSASIPWALQYVRLLAADDDLVASGAGRVLGLNQCFRDYQLQRTPDEDPVRVAGLAASMTGALLVGVMAWIDAGVVRGGLRAHLDRSLQPGI